MKNLVLILMVVALIIGCVPFIQKDANPPKPGNPQWKAVVFPKKYEERGRFFETAYQKSKISGECTLDREGMDQRKKEVFRNSPPKKGYDRVAWLMVICKEGGKHSYVDYIPSSKNQAAEKWLQKELKKYPDGQVVNIVVGIKNIKGEHIDRLEENKK
ncbi:hypothetical protein C8P63_12247 [Melghirimyces profundicolus]|uniref:Uncharacterized protein n=1 Tax=Melghirimyces profundicolus TaxID=1242148 RepID=A0A2T6BG99_9BACL|nr:hypothetical protein [Melghirimyces profundicolus]PTX55087.1 hypothetical protein C8P63_12247 [Melghirimyces profundicolus]